MRAPPSSYEMLVSFADGELDSHDRELLLSLLDLDSDLNREVWELRKLKEMVDISYQELPLPPLPLPGRVCPGGWARHLTTAVSIAVVSLVLFLLVTSAGAYLPWPGPVALSP